MGKSKPTDAPDPKRIKAAKAELKKQAEKTSDLGTHDPKEGENLRAALGEFWRAGVEAKGSDGPR